jgi:Asp-tRNA(Asn)/Glu-tRNA(Gln) amidotransferase A subunit family amidase
MLTQSGFLTNTLNHSLAHSSVGSLSGMRLAVKDLFHITGLSTTAGNPTWASTHPLPTVTNSSVEKLMMAGASLVGKTVTDELAYSLNGQNKHYGTPLNHAAPTRIPGGSSSGSACAVASKAAEIGLGTDTGGSIRVPASYNGLFGLRPSHGLIPTDNMVPLAPQFDTVGWMTRSLPEMQAVADVLIPQQVSPSQTPRIGILDPFIAQCEHQNEIANWLDSITFAKAHLSDFDPFNMSLSQAFSLLQGAQIWQQHGEWLLTHRPDIASDIQQRLDQSQQITAAQISEAQYTQQQLIEQLDLLFKHANVLVMPTTPGIAPLLDTSTDKLVDYRHRLLTMTAVAGLAGLPQLHLPLFTFKQAPCGLSLLGEKGTEYHLLRVAALLIGTP